MTPASTGEGGGRGMSASRRVVVVIGDPPSGPDELARTGAMVRRCVVALEELTRLPVQTVQTVRLDPAGRLDLVGTSARHGGPIAAVVLLGGAAEQAARMQAERAAMGAPVVVSGQDASAIVLTAATLISVNRRRRGTGTARVLVAGANRLPGLCPLLMAAGVGELTIWNTADAAAFPLARAAEGADVVINLLDHELDLAGPGPARAEEPARPVVVLAPDPVADPLLVLPALVRALSATPEIAADLTGFDLAYHDICHACALELVMATPPDQTRLPGPSGELSVRIAGAAAGALPSRVRHPSSGRRYRTPPADPPPAGPGTDA